MITFYLPNLYDFQQLNLLFIDLLKQHPEYFYPNISIGSIYGTFPGAIWNGGRVRKGHISYDQIEPLIHDYNSRGVGVRYTWTNPCLKSIHLANPFCNFIMEKSISNPLNEVIINSSILEDYIREKYPSISLISSTTKCLTSEQDINKELNKDYKLVVLDFRKNIDFSFLNSILNKEKVEILVNAYCGPDCGSRKEHYYEMGMEQLNLPHEETKLKCTFVSSFNEAFGRPTFIKVNDLYNKYYQELGFTHFKLEGRTLSYTENLQNYLYYLIQPQYYDTVRLICYDILVKKEFN